jgi:nucleoside-diphosphate-sugar epimerase
MTVLITGGTGFIGSHLAEYLARHDVPVRCLVRQNSDTSFLTSLPGVSLAYGDITNKETLPDALREIDTIYHLAAALDARHYPEETYWQCNVAGTRNMLEAAIAQGVRRFIHCSSVGVFAPSDEITRADSPQNPHPTNAYHKTKIEAEKIALDFMGEGKIGVTVVRPPAMVYGPRDSSNVLSLFRTIKKRMFVIIGSGSNIIHQIYVEDLVRGMALAGGTKKSIGEAYVLGNRQPANIERFTRAIAAALGVSIPRFHLPEPLARAAALPLEVSGKIAGFTPPLSRTRIDTLTQNRIYDTEKAREHFGFETEIDLEDGVQRTAKWYLDNGWL